MLRDQLIANGLLAAVKDDLLLEEDVMLEKAVTIVLSSRSCCKEFVIVL